MRHKFFVAAMLAAMPAVVFCAGQSPAASEQTHPSTSAHANAVAGQANAARIEACGNVSAALLDAFEKGDFKTASANFNTQMLSLVDAQKMDGVHKSLTGQLGQLESRGTPQSMLTQGMVVVSTPMHYAKGDVSAVVACEEDGKVAGFWLRPAAPAASH